MADDTATGRDPLAFLDDAPPLGGPCRVGPALTVLQADTPCTGCGACCMHVGTPPSFYGMFALAEDEAQVPEDFRETEDWAIWEVMPDDLKDELRAYYRGLEAGTVEDRCDAGPCFWFDMETRRCRHHDHRPSICREYEVGDGPCLEARRDRGIGPWTAPGAARHLLDRVLNELARSRNEAEALADGDTTHLVERHAAEIRVLDRLAEHVDGLRRTVS